MRVLIGAAVFAAFPLATTAQPFSTSMAQCGGIVAAMVQHMSTPARRDAFIGMASTWMAAAQSQASEEGVANPGLEVETTFETTRAEWEGKGAMAVFSQDFKDWMAYCASFAKDRGIDLKV